MPPPVAVLLILGVYAVLGLLLAHVARVNVRLRSERDESTRKAAKAVAGANRGFAEQVQINRTHERRIAALHGTLHGAVTLDAYQQQALRTAAMNKPEDVQKLVYACGVAGEAGEVADMIKKYVGHDHPLDRAQLRKELGDVMWYTAVIADRFGMTLSEVALANVEKLRARYPNGFDPARSLERAQGDV